MNITIYIPNPISWKYIKAEEPKHPKILGRSIPVSTAHKGYDTIQATFEYSDYLWGLFDHVGYDGKLRPPVVMEVQESQYTEKIPCTLLQPIKTEDVIECEFYVCKRVEPCQESI